MLSNYTQSLAVIFRVCGSHTANKRIHTLDYNMRSSLLILNNDLLRSQFTTAAATAMILFNVGLSPKTKERQNKINLNENEIDETDEKIIVFYPLSRAISNLT